MASGQTTLAIVSAGEGRSALSTYSNGYGYGYSPYYAPAIYSPAFSTGYYGNSYGYGNSFGYSRGYGYGGYPGYGYGGSGFSFSIGGFR